MIPLFKPYMPEELPKIDEILHSGILIYGNWLHKFENKLRDYIGNPHILTTNSFDAAYQVALSTLGLQPDDEVIGAPITCIASTQPFATHRLKLIWADVDPNTGMLDIDDVRKKITPRTKAILLYHFCGYVGRVDDILELAQNFGLYVIEDAIEGFGSEYKGKKVGCLGADVTVFSFKTIRLPNIIDGGAVAFKSQAFFEKAKIISDYGVDRVNLRDEMGEINPFCDIAIPGFGTTPSEISSYIGCLQMDVIDDLLKKQRHQAELWDNLLNKTAVKHLPPCEGSIPNYWVYGVLVDDKRTFIDQWRSKGYYASGVHVPNSYYSVFGEQPELKGVRDFYASYVALPCGWWMS